MNSKEFKLKRVLVDYLEWPRRLDEVKDQWLDALLLRVGINPLMLNRRREGKISHEAWESYLFSNWQLTINYNIKTEKITVSKMTDMDANVMKEIAAWAKPEATLKTPLEGKRYYDVSLNYWQLM